jgi:NADH dehydrogenase/NADH:ubiquinone oxidoreductase subunit G
MNFFNSGVNVAYNSVCFINSNTGNNYTNVTSTAFSTHFDSKAKSHYAIPSFYESNGHVISIEGSLRSHQKVVTPASLRHTFEIIANYAMADSLKAYYK